MQDIARQTLFAGKDKVGWGEPTPGPSLLATAGCDVVCKLLAFQYHSPIPAPLAALPACLQAQSAVESAQGAARDTAADAANATGRAAATAGEGAAYTAGAAVGATQASPSCVFILSVAPLQH